VPLPFTAKNVFRLVQNDLLRSFFSGHGELLDYPWERFALSATDPLYEAWCKLPETRRDRLFSELRTVGEVGSAEGVRKLAAEALARGLDLAPALRSLHGPWEQALWALLHHREVFDAALGFERADRLHRRYWRERTDLPRRHPDTSPAARTALAAAISALFRELRECGARCIVRWSLRGGRRHYFVAYPEDAAALIERYEGDELVARCDKPPFQVVFIYDPEEGTLALHAKGDRPLHADLQRIFMRVMLGTELPPEPRVPLRYHLHLLARRDFAFPTAPEDGIEGVRVKELGVRLYGVGRMGFDAEAHRSGQNVHDLLEPALRGHGVPLSNIDVERATLQVVFGGARPEVVPVLMTPSSCRLGEGPRRPIAARCIEASGLACA